MALASTGDLGYFFHEKNRLIQHIETNWVYIEKWEYGLFELNCSSWPGFFFKTPGMFWPEVQAVRFYLVQYVRFQIPIDPNQKQTLETFYPQRNIDENRTLLRQMIDLLWSHDEHEPSMYYTTDKSILWIHDFLEHLAVASIYYRHKFQQLNRAIIRLQRRFKEMAYAPSGPLAQKTQDRWNTRLNQSIQ